MGVRMFKDRADKPNSVEDNYLSGPVITDKLEQHPASAKRWRYGLARG